MSNTPSVVGGYYVQALPFHSFDLFDHCRYSTGKKISMGDRAWGPSLALCLL